VLFAREDAQIPPALVNGGTGVVIFVGDQYIAAMSFTVVDGRIAEIVALGDPDRLHNVDLSFRDIYPGKHIQPEGS
jgi:hypothetical protein